jgi:hypothetical protein
VRELIVSSIACKMCRAELPHCSPHQITRSCISRIALFAILAPRNSPCLQISSLSGRDQDFSLLLAYNRQSWAYTPASFRSRNCNRTRTCGFTKPWVDHRAQVRLSKFVIPHFPSMSPIGSETADLRNTTSVHNSCKNHLLDVSVQSYTGIIS